MKKKVYLKICLSIIAIALMVGYYRQGIIIVHAEESIEGDDEKAISPYLGTWVSLYRDIVENDPVYHYFRTQYESVDGPDDTYEGHLGNLNIDNIIIEDGAKLTGNTIECNDKKYTVVDENGVILLVSEGNTYVREEDYEQAVSNRFVNVTLDDNNIGEYIGPFKYIGDILDEWGEKSCDLLIMTSPAYDNGLIMLTFHDVRYQVNISNGQTVTLGEPYTTFWGWGNVYFTGFGHAKGEITYVKSEYVKNIEVGPCVTMQSNYDEGYLCRARTIEFIDGFTFDFCVTEWPNTNAPKDALLEF